MGIAIFLFVIVIVTMISVFIGIQMVFRSSKDVSLMSSEEKIRFWNGLALIFVPLSIFAMLIFLLSLA